jgi:hypothetical protein
MVVDERPETRSDGGTTMRAPTITDNRNDDGGVFNLAEDRDRENQVPLHLAATQIVAMERDDAGFVEEEQEGQKQKQQQLLEPSPPPPPSAPSLPSPPSSSPPPALSAEQRAALAAIDSGFNVFVTGAAGTGKSVLLRAAIELLRRKLDVEGEGDEGQQPSSSLSSSSSSSVAVVAPTGVAAAAVGGSTVHAFAGCGLSRSLADLDRMRRGPAAERWRRARALVVDEVSMLSGEFLSELDAAARVCRGKPGRSFGGIQLVLVGDFAQLAPVASSGSSGSSFRHRGLAFQSPAWRAARLAPFILTVPFRQNGQGAFLRLLAEIRVGDPSGRAMAELARRCGGGGGSGNGRGGGSDRPPLAPAAGDGSDNGERRRRRPPPSSSSTPSSSAAPAAASSRLYCLNKDVDLENAKRLAELPGAEPPVSFRAADELVVLSSLAAGGAVEGEARLGLSRCSFLQRDCLARGVVELKAQALVMLLKNNSFGSNGGSGGGEGAAEDAAAAARTAGISSSSAAPAAAAAAPLSSSIFPLFNGSMGTVLGFATVRAIRRYAAGVGGSSSRAAGAGEKRERSRAGSRARKRPRAAAIAGVADAADDDAPSSSSEGEEEEEEGGESDDEDEDASACRQLFSWQLPRSSAASALLSLSLPGARTWLEANRRPGGGGGGAGGGGGDPDLAVLLPVVRFLPPPSPGPAAAAARGRVEAVPPATFASRVPGRGSVARTQLPLRLAWALSVHKCQGMSLDRVTVCLRGAFACGQAYVALSRARSLEGLSIELGGGGAGDEGRRGAVRADPLVARFDAAVAAAVAARNARSGNSFREGIAALASFRCRIFGARMSLAVDAVEAANGGGGSGNGNGAKKKQGKKKAAAEDDGGGGDGANYRARAPPPLAAEILSGIQCYSCRGWGHVVAACPLARASGKGGEKKKKKEGKGNCGGLEVGGGHRRPSRRRRQLQS